MGFISRHLESLYKSVLFSRQDPDGRIFYFSHSDFNGLIKEPFDFRTRKGHLLKGGFYHYCTPSSDRLIVFDHGLATGHRAYMREIEILARHGYLVYSYDHTGTGESEGEGVQGLSGSLADLDDCIRALKRLSGISGREISSSSNTGTPKAAAYNSTSCASFSLASCSRRRMEPSGSSAL